MHELLNSYFSIINGFVSILEVYNAILLQTLLKIIKFLTQKVAQIIAPGSANRKTSSECKKRCIGSMGKSLKTILDWRNDIQRFIYCP